MKILSISVAAYNSEGWLERCINSLTNNGVADELDIIIVNDGSTDKTLEIANSLKKRFPDTITVIDKENGGHGSTINAAIKNARGKYFKIVDSDDWVEKEGIEKLVESLRGSDADVVFNPYYIVNADTYEKTFRNEGMSGQCANKISDIESLKKPFKLIMHEMCFRTDAIKSNWTDLDEHCFYVDAEYTFYNFYCCKTVQFLTFPVYDYLLGTAEQSMNFSNMIKRREQQEKVCIACITFYEKHKADSGKIKRAIFKDRLYSLLLIQYRILICLPYKESKEKFQNFDKRFKKLDPHLYEAFLHSPLMRKTKSRVIITKIRKNQYKGYLIYNLLYRKKYLK